MDATGSGVGAVLSQWSPQEELLRLLRAGHSHVGSRVSHPEGPALPSRSRRWSSQPLLCAGHSQIPGTTCFCSPTVLVAIHVPRYPCICVSLFSLCSQPGVPSNPSWSVAAIAYSPPSKVSHRCGFCNRPACICGQYHHFIRCGPLFQGCAFHSPHQVAFGPKDC